MITSFAEMLSWLAFLERAPVLHQLLASAAVLLASLLLRRLPRGRLLPDRPLALLLPLGLTLLLLLLRALGHPLGLVLLFDQIALAWLLLRLLERMVLVRLMPAEAVQRLTSRLLRPLFLVAVVLVLLDTLGSLTDLGALPLGVWFGGRISLGDLSTVLLVLYLLLVGLPLPAAGISLLVQRGLGISEGSRRALDQILRYVIMMLGLIWAMARLGFNQTGVLALAGGLSVGLGFGIKEVFSNIVSGLWLLIEGSVRPGEVLMHEGVACEVRHLGPRATTLWRRGDNAEVVVPNQTFFTAATTSYTRSDRLRRCSLTLSVARSHNPYSIVSRLEAIAASHADVLALPPPRASLEEFGPERYGYRLSVSIADPLKAGSVSAELRLMICRQFAELGIDPPA